MRAGSFYGIPRKHEHRDLIDFAAQGNSKTIRELDGLGERIVDVDADVEADVQINGGEFRHGHIPPERIHTVGSGLGQHS